MQLKKLALLITFNIFYIGHTLAQTTYYISSKGKIVSTSDSAQYTRVVNPPDSDSKYYRIAEYYLDGKLRLTGKSSQARALVLEGYSVGYFPNGQKQQVASYIRGMRNGDVYSYFPNGHLWSVIKYEVQHPAPNSYIQNRPVYKTCDDSTGKHRAVDGNGFFVIYSADYKMIAEQGPVKVGEREGDWMGTELLGENKITFTETYLNGKLVKGQSVEGNGATHDYTQISTPPVFTDGNDKYSQFLSTNIRYPNYERVQNIQGRVFAQFVVEADGSITDIQIMRSPSEGLGNEAKRVVSLSPNWKPGLYRGVPARVRYTVPINFTLTSN
jgi:TonB family protein